MGALLTRGAASYQSLDYAGQTLAAWRDYVHTSIGRRWAALAETDVQMLTPDENNLYKGVVRSNVEGGEALKALKMDSLNKEKGNTGNLNNQT